MQTVKTNNPIGVTNSKDKQSNWGDKQKWKKKQKKVNSRSWSKLRSSLKIARLIIYSLDRQKR